MPWQLENKLVARGVRVLQPWLGTRAGNFLLAFVGILRCGLGGSGGLERAEGKEWGAARPDLSILASGPLPSFPTHATEPLPLVLASLFPLCEFNPFFSENPLSGIYILAFRLTLEPVAINCEVLDPWFSTLAAR